VYGAYLILTPVFIFLLPVGPLESLTLWKRAGLASIISTFLSSAIYYVLIVISPRINPGRFGMTLAPLIVVPGIVTLTTLVIKSDIALSVEYHTAYAFLVALCFLAADRMLFNALSSDPNQALYPAEREANMRGL
jgi:hypothetical protein